MLEEEIAALRAENAKLRGELEILRDCSYKHFDLFTKHIGDISDDVRDIYNYLTPLLNKVCPGLLKTRKQIDQVLTRPRRRNSGEDSA